MASKRAKKQAKGARARARELRKKSGKRTGRPSLFTPERVEKILAALQLGAYRQTAAQYAGISDSTLQDWLLLSRTALADGEDGTRAMVNREEYEKDPEGVVPILEPVTRFAQLFGAVEDAEASAEVRSLGQIQEAAQSAWQAAAWILERKHRDRWGRPTTLQVSGPGGGPVKLDAEVADKRGVVIMPPLKEDE